MLSCFSLGNPDIEFAYVQLAADEFREQEIAGATEI